MIKAFLEGDSYRNPKLPQDVMVLGIAKEDAKEVVMAVLFVDRESDETTGGGELTVQKADFGDWEHIDV